MPAHLPLPPPGPFLCDCELEVRLVSIFPRRNYNMYPSNTLFTSMWVAPAINDAESGTPYSHCFQRISSHCLPRTFNWEKPPSASIFQAVALIITKRCAIFFIFKLYYDFSFSFQLYLAHLPDCGQWNEAVGLYIFKRQLSFLPQGERMYNHFIFKLYFISFLSSFGLPVISWPWSRHVHHRQARGLHHEPVQSRVHPHQHRPGGSLRRGGPVAH